MSTAEERWAKSFYATLRQASDNCPINFSKVVFVDKEVPVGGNDIASVNVERRSGYDLEFTDYLTANSFEDDPLTFYFRYDESDDGFSMITPAGEWLAISAGGYLYKTTDPQYCKHFRILSSDRTKRLSLATMTDDQYEVIIQILGIDYVWNAEAPTQVGDYKWSYMASWRGFSNNGCRLKLNITHRGGKGYID